MYEFRFDVVWQYLPYLAKGVWITIWVTLASTGIGLVLGIVIAVLRLSSNPILSMPMRAYIEFFRNTPTLVKLVWVFYLIPILLGLKTEALTSCIIAMAVSAAAYIAEVVRAGIQDVPRGDIEAAEAVGMTPMTVLRRIVLPQALRKVLPPLANTFIVFLKYSSLVSVVGVNDLMYRANVISTTTFRPIETYTVLAVFYFVLCYGLSKAFSRFEARMAVDV
ncbi:MAG TPA: amino acid ABC transporter permease [Casimicrobiaceae bacterium]|nr:amino acid ABC transporter permease [Casimicrobiaceae bacterium]